MLISRLKRYLFAIHIVLLSILDLLAKKKGKIQKDKLLVIRLDAIGDYVLFRNFLQLIKESKDYSNHSITLVGNEAWKGLAESLDKQYVDSFIWINKKKFYRNYLYRIRKIKKITAIGYDLVLNPMFSREYIFSEAIVKVVNSIEKIGCVGDNSNISIILKKQAGKSYTQLLPSSKKVLFEYYRNWEFFRQLLNVPLLEKPALQIKLDKLSQPHKLPDRYVVLFLGASHRSRQWSAENFAKVGLRLKEHYNYEIVICGASTDREQAEQFKTCFKAPYIDLVGKTSLLELLDVISNCQLIVSNETSAVHFAVALGIKPIFVLYNGCHFGRFAPYPRELHDSYYLICHPEIAKNKEQYEIISNQRGYLAQLNINDITTDSIIGVIDSYLTI